MQEILQEISNFGFPHHPLHVPSHQIRRQNGTTHQQYQKPQSNNRKISDKIRFNKVLKYPISKGRKPCKKNSIPRPQSLLTPRSQASTSELTHHPLSR